MIYELARAEKMDEEEYRLAQHLEVKAANIQIALKNSYLFRLSQYKYRHYMVRSLWKVVFGNHLSFCDFQYAGLSPYELLHTHLSFDRS